MKIAIMGAMPEETAPIIAQLEDTRSETTAKNRYTIGRYKGTELVVAYSKIGKVFAALTAATLLERYDCDMLLFSGVAGAINPSLSIGDLIVASSLCQHDLDITAFGHPYGYVPEGEVFIKSDEGLRKIAHRVAEKKGIALREGVIATGDQFVADSACKAWIAKTFGADALEMEGAAVAVVCDALNRPFCILRSISDAADMDAGFDFDTFLESSAKRSADFILSMVEEIAHTDALR